MSTNDAEEQRGENSLMTVVQKNNHLEAIVEDGDQPSGVIFFLGDGQEGGESESCQIRTPVEVHRSVETTGLLDNEVASVGEQSGATSDTTEQQTGGHQASDGLTNPEGAKLDVDLKEEDLHLTHSGELYQCDSVEVNHAVNSQHVVEEVCCEVAQNQGLVSSSEDIRDEEKQSEPEDEESMKSKSGETPAHGSVVLGENDNVEIALRVEGCCDDDDVQPEQECDSDGVKGESDEEGGSLHSSNESIMKVTDEESVCDEAEESLREEFGFEKSSSTEETLWSEGSNILDLHINGYPEERDGDAVDGTELSGSLDTNSTVKAADLTENSDFSILEASGSPGLADQKYQEEDEPLPGDCTEVEAC